MVNLIHIFTSNPDHPAIDHYKKLNPKYEIIRYYNYEGMAEKYVNYLNQLQPLIHAVRNYDTAAGKQCSIDLVRYDFFKLDILEKYGGWWCDTFRTINEPLDDLAEKYKTQYKFSLFLFHFFTTNNIYVSPTWDQWHLFDSFVSFILNSPKNFRNYWLKNATYNILQLNSQHVQIITDEGITIPISQQDRTPKMVYDEQKNSPEVISMIKRYMDAHTKWVKAGKPLRSSQEIKDIYAICENCQHFRKDLFGSRCGICNCRLHDTRKQLNKIAMATESCPDTPPKWVSINS